MSCKLSIQYSEGLLVYCVLFSIVSAIFIVSCYQLIGTTDNNDELMNNVYNFRSSSCLHSCSSGTTSTTTSCDSYRCSDRILYTDEKYVCHMIVCDIV